MVVLDHFESNNRMNNPKTPAEIVIFSGKCVAKLIKNSEINEAIQQASLQQATDEANLIEDSMYAI